MASGRRGRVCSARLSIEQVIQVRRASSLAVQASRHSGRMFGFENFSRLLTKDRASRSGRPNTICAGDTYVTVWVRHVAQLKHCTQEAVMI